MCLFCDIIEGKIPSTKVYEDSAEDGAEYLGAVAGAVDKIAELKGLEKGFRVINNCGEDGGQTVMHVHFHVVGGVKLSEKIL